MPRRTHLLYILYLWKLTKREFLPIIYSEILPQRCFRMVFSSLIFLYAFLPLSLAVYALCRSLRAKNISLLVFSLIFYAWGEPVYVLLLMAMALFDWYFALRVQRAQREEKSAKLWVALACVVNLGLIGFFKYAGMVCSIFGDVPAFVQRIALPLGISFYTFQLLSYVVDVYRGDAEAQDKYLACAALRRALPPVHRRSHRPVQDHREGTLRSGRDETADRARGMYALCRWPCKENGARKSLRRAGRLSSCSRPTRPSNRPRCFAENLSSALRHSRRLGAWVGVAAFMRARSTFDFSAYSDMAIGMGRMLGLHYLENFNYPYISKHRHGVLAAVAHVARHLLPRLCLHPARRQPAGRRARAFLNLFIVWALTGLWHGASWNFVLWGLYLLCSAHARAGCSAEAARHAAEGCLGDPIAHHAPARGALRAGCSSTSRIRSRSLRRSCVACSCVNGNALYELRPLRLQIKSHTYSCSSSAAAPATPARTICILRQRCGARRRGGAHLRRKAIPLPPMSYAPVLLLLLITACACRRQL